MTTVERWASRVLLVGGLLGVALMVSGLLGLMLVRAEWRIPAAIDRAAAVGTIVSLPGIWAALSHRPVDPGGLAALGVVMLVATPMAAVGSAAVAFALEGDRRFVMVAAIVVAMLALSVWCGAG